MCGSNQPFLDSMKAKSSDLRFLMILNNPFPFFTLLDYHPSRISWSVAGLHFRDGRGCRSWPTSGPEPGIMTYKNKGSQL